MTLRRPLSLAAFVLSAAVVYAADLYAAGLLGAVPHADVLAYAVTADLVLLVPLLYYLFVVRGRGWPAVTVAPVFLISLLAAGGILPEPHHGLLDALAWFAVPAELFVVGFVAVKARQVARAYRAAGTGTTDPAAQLRVAARQALGDHVVADIVAFELALLYYAVLSWRRRPATGGFSHHRRAGYGAVLGTLGVVMAVETVGLHVLVQRWSPAAAWVLTALSLYALVWLLGDLQAVRLRPLRVERDALVLRVGLRWTLVVPFDAVEVLRPFDPQRDGRKRRGYLAAVVAGGPRYLLVLRHPLQAEGPYGLRRTVRAVGFRVDAPEVFEEALQAAYTDWEGRQGGT
jgi:hypothetical protein